MCAPKPSRSSAEGRDVDEANDSTPGAMGTMRVMVPRDFPPEAIELIEVVEPPPDVVEAAPLEEPKKKRRKRRNALQVCQAKGLPPHPRAEVGCTVG